MITDFEPHPLVQVALAPPPLQRLAHRGVARDLGGNELVKANRLLQIALALDDLRQLRASPRQLGVELERLLEQRLRLRIMPLQECRGSGAQPQRGILQDRA